MTDDQILAVMRSPEVVVIDENTYDVTIAAGTTRVTAADITGALNAAREFFQNDPKTIAFYMNKS